VPSPVAAETALARIARISPADGRVLGWIDLTGLLAADDRAQPVDFGAHQK